MHSLFKDKYVCWYALNDNGNAYYKDCIEVFCWYVLFVNEEHL